MNITGNRRGSFAAYIDIEHEDFDECINDLFVNSDGKNYGWVIRDSFIERLVKDEPEAQRRFNEILYLKAIHGKGYFFFVDKANRQRPQMYKDLGLDIKASNLCVHGDTTILTDQGNLVIKDLENQNVNVWNGKQWSNTQVVKTNTNQELIEVTLNTGESIKCTPYHKFYVQEGYSSKPIEKRASELNINDKLIKFNVEAIQGGNKKLDKPYQNGFFTGDGCSYKGKSIVYLYNDKKSLRHKFTDVTYESSYKERITLHVNGLQDKFFIPNSDYSIKDRLDWLAGLMDADGTVVTNGTNESLQLASINPEFLRDLQQMLLTLGVRSKVTLNKKACKTSMPKNDGTSDYALYDCKQIERILISSSALYKLAQLGFKCERLQFTANKPQRNAEQFSKVESIKMVEGLHDTYCFNEPLEHKGIFNGILTGNCSEIMLHSSPEYTFSCILSSINLMKWDEIKDDDTIFNSTVFLDCVTSDFLAKSAGIRGLEKVRKFTEKGRAIGLGVMGLHTHMQHNNIAFDSMAGMTTSNLIFKRLQEESLRASQWMAQELGEPEWCKGYGVRNTHRCVTGDTEVITKQGSKPIKSLVGQTLEIWNGYEWSVMTPFITSESEEVYKVTLSNGKEVICTPDHKWAVKNNRHRKPISVETIDLKEGDKLNKWDYPTLEGDKELSHPYTSGFFSGDGSYSQSKPQYPNCKQRKEIRICPKSGKEVCLDYLSVKDGCTVRDSNGGYRFYIPDEVSEKFFVPNEDYTVNSRLKWLAGLLDADGSNAGTFTAINLEFAKKVVHLANVTGLYASLTTEKPARVSEIEGRTINCKPLYKVGFSRKQLVESYDKGLTIRRLDFGKPNRESIDYVSVISVEKKGNSKTYCVTDKLRGTCMFNGITTLQCAQAPTKSTALLMGGVSEGINPDPGMVFEASSSVGELTRITPVIYELMKQRGVYNTKTVRRIIDNVGSVQQEDWLTPHEKQVFKTAFEINQETILNMASARQNWLCQGQSLNFYFPEDGSEELLARLISLCFINENILSQYYIYSRSGVIVNDECLSCSA